MLGQRSSRDSASTVLVLANDPTRPLSPYPREPLMLGDWDEEG